MMEDKTLHISQDGPQFRPKNEKFQNHKILLYSFVPKQVGRTVTVDASK